METREEYTTVKEMVLQLLQEDERCRNDDNWLAYKVFSIFTKIYIPFEDFKKLPSFETISRCRRLIQNKEGMYPPTEESVVRRRHSRQEEVKEFVSDDWHSTFKVDK